MFTGYIFPSLVNVCEFFTGTIWPFFLRSSILLYWFVSNLCKFYISHHIATILFSVCGLLILFLVTFLQKIVIFVYSNIATFPSVISSFFFFGLFVFLPFFFFPRAAPLAHGDSQARGLIRAVATGLCQNHSNVGSKTHLQPKKKINKSHSYIPVMVNTWILFSFLFWSFLVKKKIKDCLSTQNLEKIKSEWIQVRNFLKKKKQF